MLPSSIRLFLATADIAWVQTRKSEYTPLKIRTISTAPPPHSPQSTTATTPKSTTASAAASTSTPAATLQILVLHIARSHPPPRPMTDLLSSTSQVNAVCLDLLLQEIVPASIRVAHRLDSTSDSRDPAADRSHWPSTTISTPLSSIPGDTPGTVAVFTAQNLESDDVAARVDAYGYALGLRLTEVLMYKASPPSRPEDILDIMKFVCREVWRCLYGKQMDNLRTNHRGTFVLIDNSQRLMSQLDSADGQFDTYSKGRVYMWFPCGVIRGALLSFGIAAHVTADATHHPAVTFNIQTSINN